MSISPTFALGFHSQNQFDNVFGKKNSGTESKAQVKVLNIMHIVGYFPLVGTITGIIKLILLRSKEARFFREDAGPSLVKAYVARWIVETLSLGALLLIPDLIVSTGRAYNSKFFNF